MRTSYPPTAILNVVSGPLLKLLTLVDNERFVYSSSLWHEYSGGGVVGRGSGVRGTLSDSVYLCGYIMF